MGKRGKEDGRKPASAKEPAASIEAARKPAAEPDARSTIGSRGVAADEEELLQELRDLANELGRTPAQREVVAAAATGKAHNLKTFRRRFGSLATALRLAGLKIAPGPLRAPRPRTASRPKAVRAAAPAVAASPAASNQPGELSPAEKFALAQEFVRQLGGVDAARQWLEVVNAAGG